METSLEFSTARKPRREVRRHWPYEVKAKIVSESSRPGTTVNEVAQRNGLRANSLSTWRAMARQGKLILPAPEDAVEFAAVIVDTPVSEPPYKSVSRPEIIIGPVTIRLEEEASASRIPGKGLAKLFGYERNVSLEEDTQNRQRWEKLMIDNAPFRVVTENGLASAPIDHFDALLLAQATSEWKTVAFVVGSALGLSHEPYLQVGDMALHERLTALVEEGSLIADGDPSEMRACRVRLPI